MQRLDLRAHRKLELVDGDCAGANLVRKPQDSSLGNVNNPIDLLKHVIGRHVATCPRVSELQTIKIPCVAAFWGQDLEVERRANDFFRSSNFAERDKATFSELAAEPR